MKPISGDRLGRDSNGTEKPMGKVPGTYWRYTAIDAPGHGNAIKNVIPEAFQVNVALIVVPAG